MEISIFTSMKFVRKASGTSVGDRVSVELSFDAKYRSGPQHRMPHWFKQALDPNPTGTEELDGTDPQSQERNTAPFLAVEVFGRSYPQSLQSLTCSVGRSRAIHGSQLEKRIIASFHTVAIRNAFLGRDRSAKRILFHRTNLCHSFRVIDNPGFERFLPIIWANRW
jgi:hypothetical protein